MSRPADGNVSRRMAVGKLCSIGWLVTPIAVGSKLHLEASHGNKYRPAMVDDKGRLDGDLVVNMVGKIEMGI